MMFRRFLASLLAALLVVAQVQQVAALTPAQRVVVLSGVQGWSLPGSSADLYFARNAGSCAINRLAKPCSSLISTSRASTGQAKWSDGHFSSFAANTARITDLGLLVEQASTNKALWSNDWTNAAYVKVNVTAAMDQVGPDNAANSASSITATSNGGTILQTVTEAATTNTESVYLKRITGTGAITLVQNGVSGTTCTLSTTVWTICTVTGSVLNPALGIIMATSGDKIAVWGGQFEALAFNTSPIPTTTTSAVRAADAILFAASLVPLFGLPAFTVAGNAIKQANVAGDIFSGNLSSSPNLSDRNHALTDTAGGVAEVSFTAISLSPLTLNIKTVFAYRAQTGNYGISVGNATTQTSVNALSVTTPTSVGLGYDATAVTNYFNGFIGRFAGFNTGLTNAQLQALKP
jgi:hypothetical protein